MKRDRKKYSQKRRKERKRRGLCYDCKNKACVNAVLCEKCATRHRKRRALQRERLKRLGLCAAGDGNALVTGSVCCQKCLTKNAETARAKHAALRNQVLEGYGGMCACCDEWIPDFLTLDHVQNDGANERKASDYNLMALYRRLIKEGFPLEYQLLCWNCNCGRAKNGGVCPHRGRAK